LILVGDIVGSSGGQQAAVGGGYVGRAHAPHGQAGYPVLQIAVGSCRGSGKYIILVLT